MSRDRTTIIRTPPCAPVAHPYAERSVGTVRRELRDRTVIWNTRQLAHLLNEYGVVWCYTEAVTERTHEYEIVCACGNRWRLQAAEEPEMVECSECGGRRPSGVETIIYESVSQSVSYPPGISEPETVAPNAPLAAQIGRSGRYPGFALGTFAHARVRPVGLAYASQRRA